MKVTRQWEQRIAEQAREAERALWSVSGFVKGGRYPSALIYAKRAQEAAQALVGLLEQEVTDEA